MEPANWSTVLSAAFRETFLCSFDPEEAAAFRTFGNMVENRFLDRAADATHAVDAGSAPSYTLAEMRGAARDLKFLTAFLEIVGKEREASELSLRDWRLASLAEEIARDLGALAVRLEGEMARLADGANP